jgi:hypothetical protein
MPSATQLILARIPADKPLNPGLAEHPAAANLDGKRLHIVTQIAFADAKDRCGFMDVDQLVGRLLAMAVRARGQDAGCAGDHRLQLGSFQIRECGYEFAQTQALLAFQLKAKLMRSCHRFFWTALWEFQRPKSHPTAAPAVRAVARNLVSRSTARLRLCIDA